MESNLEGCVKALAKSLDCRFWFKGESMQYDKVFSHTGFLPALLHRANQLSLFCLGKELGVTFERDEGSVLQIRSLLDDKVPMMLRLIFLLDVLYELVQAAPSPQSVRLDELAQS